MKTNEDKIKEYKKNYMREKRKDITYLEKEKLKQKEYESSEEYKEYKKNYMKEYANVNKDKIKEYKKNYMKKRRNEDFIFKISNNISNSIRQALRKKGYEKNSNTEHILGCSYEFFVEYIKNQFEDWMTYDNYGLYEINKYNIGWDIDHICPISNATSEDEVIKLNHYTNLRPLCSKINRDIKKDIY
jgi:hypothetical protein